MKPITNTKEDRDFTLEDVKESLNPLFVLLESMESLELLKSDMQHSTDS